MSTDKGTSAILSTQTFELRMMSHKIKQINSPSRFPNVVFVCLRLLTPVLHLKEKVHIHLKKTTQLSIKTDNQHLS